ncbi:MAG: PadR family transcriptional regulator [Acidimicrobiales bacterium]
MSGRHHGERSGRRGVARYIESSLLLLLAERRAHGWELSERLKDVFPLPGNLPDVSTVYRALADLEGQGAVRSELTPGDGGGRKVYELTDVGWDLLAFWEEQFTEEQRGLVRLLQVFEQTRGRRKTSRA